MKGILYLLAITAVLVSLASCHTAKPSTSNQASIIGKSWNLVEINGKSIQTAQGNKQPHLILHADKKANGNSGCNSFFGSYELQGDNKISFSQIGATKMACQNGAMEVEHQLFQAFETASQYTFKNNILSLNKADGSPVAKFVLSPTK